MRTDGSDQSALSGRVSMDVVELEHWRLETLQLAQDGLMKFSEGQREPHRSMKERGRLTTSFPQAKPLFTSSYKKHTLAATFARSIITKSSSGSVKHSSMTSTSSMRKVTISVTVWNDDHTGWPDRSFIHRVNSLTRASETARSGGGSEQAGQVQGPTFCRSSCAMRSVWGRGYGLR